MRYSLGPLFLVVILGTRDAAGQSSEAKPVRLEVRLPADAELEIEGDKMRSTGPVRQYKSPPLPTERDVAYTYTLRATFKGQTVSRKVSVTPGTAQVIDLNSDFQPRPLPLWDRLGGGKGVKRIVDELIVLAARNPRVNFDRSGQNKLDPEAVEGLKTQLVDWLSEVSGGPKRYRGKSMKDAHKGMGITDAEFDALLANFKEALEKHVPSAGDVAEMLEILGSIRKEIVEPVKPSRDSQREGGQEKRKL